MKQFEGGVEEARNLKQLEDDLKLMSDIHVGLTIPYYILLKAAH